MTLPITVERDMLRESRRLLVERLEQMQKDRVGWIGVAAALALVHDCDRKAEVHETCQSKPSEECDRMLRKACGTPVQPVLRNPKPECPQCGVQFDVVSMYSCNRLGCPCFRNPELSFPARVTSGYVSTAPVPEQLEWSDGNSPD